MTEAVEPDGPTVRNSAPLLACDGQGLKALVQAGLTWLERHQEIVNAQNVYPVPDGDTGTNMVLTMRAAYAEIADDDSHHAGHMAHGVAQGARLGGRGNSGIILSQLWRGFARIIATKETFNAELFGQAMQEAQKTAYLGVGRPVEGTILTVAREAAEAAVKAAVKSTDLIYVLQQVVVEAQQSVARTPALLPIHRQAGVVDAGGQGLAYIFEGAYRYLVGLPLTTGESKIADVAATFVPLETIEAGQDWEIVADVRLNHTLDWPKLHQELAQLGTSIQLAGEDESLRLHIHVPEDGLFRTQAYLLQLGTVTKMALENLRDQVAVLQGPPKQIAAPANPITTGQVGVVTVVAGDGLKKVFQDLGAAAIVSGGPSMNPSTQEILQAIRAVPSDRVIVLPNNKNIMMAAQQAQELAGQESRQVTVLPTRSIPEGIAAMLAWQPDESVDHNLLAMERATSQVISGAVTTAVRGADLDGHHIESGQIMGLNGEKLVATGNTLDEVVQATLSRMGAADREIVTLYYGEQIRPEQAENLARVLRQNYPNQEIEVIPGGQPHYPYLLSVE